jgi:transcriptional repressor NrdR
MEPYLDERGIRSMICPVCNTDGDRVTDSRPTPDGRAIRRRRECLACGNRFTTYEQVETPGPIVIKADGRRENFNIEKLSNSLHLALKKRPVSRDRLQATVTDLSIRIKNDFPTEIASARIADLVLSELLKLDEVAYVRYASYCRSFGDKDEFIAALRALPGSLQVVKSTGRYEPFKRDKLISSMIIALRKRPVSRRKIEKVAEEIIDSFANRSEVNSSEIGNLVMKKLLEIDEVAYIRYASVYRKFRDAAEFAKEVENLSDEDAR